ncbi:MAG TPA: retron St85 family RNA-directed DNA polymerase [Sideroxyarcus sp.]|nr:retron St85 family RNA-directed DNA polymerase [Sideroxyarcus sp.]
MAIKEIISRDLNIPLSIIDEALKAARSHVKTFHIAKRNGKDRLILQPSKKLKTIQYWLIINVFGKHEVHKAAMAYVNNKSILDNAILHRENKFFVKMDLRDFFPSIKYSDLKPRILEWHRKTSPEWELDTEAENLIRLSCFYKDDRLAVGYPSSPIISNIVMMEFDIAVSNLISDTSKYGDAIYSRYADDLVISTNKSGVSNLIIKNISALISETLSPKISLNSSKTRIGSSTGGTASVTGLKICNNGHITIHRKQKDHIRLLLSLYKKGLLKDLEYESLLGHLAYVRHVDSTFYSKLQNKYFSEISQLRIDAAEAL